MRVKNRALLAGAATMLLAPVVACSVPASDADSTAAFAASDWPTWQKDDTGSRFNAAEEKITPETVGNLKLKWAYAYDKVPESRMGSQPAIADGTLYVGSPTAKFLALDAKSGETKWTFDLTTVTGSGGELATNSVRDGAAVAGDKVYFGDSTGRVYALDRATGRLAWAKQISRHSSSTMTGSPLVFDGKVYIGESTQEGGEASDPNYPCCTHRGQVVALDAETGDVAWRYHTVPPARQAGTWPSGAKKYAPSGGSVWSSPVVDAGSRTIYVGTGNNSTGDEGDIDSMLALNVDTGDVRWKHRLTDRDVYTAACESPDLPRDYCPGKGTYARDWDVGSTPNVITKDGRTLVAVGQKDGRFHAFDARTGEIAWQTTVVDAPPASGAGLQWGSTYDGKWIYAATWRNEPSELVALDPATGRIAWRSAHPADGCETGGASAHPELCEEAFTPAVTGTPGLLYEGSSDGKMRIFSADGGQRLWEFDAVRDFAGVNGKTGHGTAISGNGGAVVVDGMVYVQAGYYPFYPSDKGGVLLAFGLE